MDIWIWIYGYVYAPCKTSIARDSSGGASVGRRGTAAAAAARKRAIASLPAAVSTAWPEGKEYNEISVVDGIV